MPEHHSPAQLNRASCATCAEDARTMEQRNAGSKSLQPSGYPGAGRGPSPAQRGRVARNARRARDRIQDGAQTQRRARRAWSHAAGSKPAAIRKSKAPSAPIGASTTEDAFVTNGYSPDWIVPDPAIENKSLAESGASPLGWRLGSKPPRELARAPIGCNYAIIRRWQVCGMRSPPRAPSYVRFTPRGCRFP